MRSQLAPLVQRLAEKLRVAHRTMTILVDGLAEVDAKDRTAAREIVELLPFGRPAFRFLISGDVEGLLRNGGCDHRPYPLTLFSIEETRKLFKGLEVSRDAVARAHSSCNGGVGHLAAIRRLVESGLQIDEVLEKQLGAFGDTMQMEWDRVKELTVAHPQVLAFIAFDARRYTSDSLASAVRLEFPILSLHPGVVA